MTLLSGLFVLPAFVVLALFAFTRFGSFVLERTYPASGDFLMAGSTRIHYHHLVSRPDAPTIIFIHGASGNLHDPMAVYRPLLEGQFNLLFFDRPGHGYSGTSADDITPKGQAETLAALMDGLGIEKATLVGHSFGGAVASSFALFHPDKTESLLLLSPVSHPWPGGVNWYYTLMTVPFFGWLFSETIAMPAGLQRLRRGTACVFAPNKPWPNYLTQTRVPLLLRPRQFRENGKQIAALFDYVSKIHQHYKNITAPTIILTGNRDTIVLPEIHSVGLARDIDGAELHWVKNLGHKSDHIGTEFVLAALDNLAGSATHDLQALAALLEAQLAHDNFGPIERCLNSDVIEQAIRKEDSQRLKSLAQS